MDITNMPTLTIPNYTYLGNLIPVNEVTLLAGLAGTGKSYSLLKFLNLQSIIPIYVNLDATPIGNLLANQYDTLFLDHAFIQRDLTGIQGKVIVLDTYQRLSEYLQYETKLKNTELQQHIANLLEGFAHYYGCTVIVIGHPEDYVGKDGIFKDNPILVRNCAEYLHLDSILPRGKTGTTKDIEYKLTVKKGRGNGGTRIIDEWMRKPALNPLTNQMC